MNIQELEEMLYQETESEHWHLLHPGQLSHFYDTLEKKRSGGEEYYFFDFKNSLKKEMYTIVEETRYTTIPSHFHKDMEMNYVYRGTCTFLINVQEIVMDQGDVCILDSNVVHSAVSLKGQDDIIINLVFQKRFFDNTFLDRLSRQGVVSSFLVNAIYRDQAHDSYILFHGNENERIHTLIQFLMCTYFDPGVGFRELTYLYFASLFTELSSTTYRVSRKNLEQDKLLSVLKYIELNYNTCTLTSAAKQFGYNANYLSCYLKKETGSSFMQIKAKQQMVESASFLKNTDFSVSEIADLVGITNITYFYKRFTDEYHMTPGEYRNEAKKYQIAQ